MYATTVLGFVLVLSARSVVADAAEDAKKIQGTWVVTPATFDVVPDEKARKEGIKLVAGMRFTFQEGELTIEHQPGRPPFEKGSKESSAFRLAPTRTPKQIDLGERGRGIYELDEDTLKLCWDIRGKENGRPDMFGFDKDKPTVVYYVLKREKK
jgi:uncharacterized protein (TIGR03067 family)